MSVRYKFKSEKNFSQILFSGSTISLGDVKKEIFKQRRLGKSENIDLMISNAENGESSTNDDTLIPKNTSLIVVRVPNIHKSVFVNQVQEKTSNEKQENSILKMSSDLSKLNATEEEKIYAMMMQSTIDYQNYQNSVPPSTYVCRKCKVPGHWIRNCTLSIQKSHRFNPKEKKESTKMTGIPKTMRGNINKIENNFVKFSQEISKVPENIFCSICRDIYRNPIRMPCCNQSFCYECAVVKVLESEESDCPSCGVKFIQPGSLLDDLEMRKNVENSIKLRNSNFLQYSRNLQLITN